MKSIWEWTADSGPRPEGSGEGDERGLEESWGSGRCSSPCTPVSSGPLAAQRPLTHSQCFPAQQHQVLTPPCKGQRPLPAEDTSPMPTSSWPRRRAGVLHRSFSEMLL